MLSLFRAAPLRLASAFKCSPSAMKFPIQRGFAEAAAAEKKGKKAKAGNSEANARIKREQAFFDESDMYIDWEKFIAWLDAPAAKDPRSKQEKAADEEVCRVYAKNMSRMYVQRQKFFDSMARCQMEAVANLPEELRARALVFDPILPPVHPRVGAPREFPIASRLKENDMDLDDDKSDSDSSAGSSDSSEGGESSSQKMDDGERISQKARRKKNAEEDEDPESAAAATKQ